MFRLRGKELEDCSWKFFYTNYHELTANYHVISVVKKKGGTFTVPPFKMWLFICQLLRTDN